MAIHPISTGSKPNPARPERRAWYALSVGALLLVAGAALALDLLPPDRAFALSARALNDHTLEARFNVADGYYLYRDKLKFGVEPAAAGPLKPVLPPGKIKHDEFFGDVETYRGLVVLKLPMARAEPGSKVKLATESQGCADAGVCFPPQVQELTINVPAAGAGPSALVDAAAGKLPWMR
jgi:thioredoxin:protein disulfide reductase